MPSKQTGTQQSWGVSLDQAVGALATSAPARFAELFATSDCSVEIYAPVGKDLQKPHDRDELYFVVRGHATFYDGTKRRAVAPGAALFVAAGVPHRFEDFTADFVVWVVFVGPKKAIAKPDRPSS